MSEVNCDVCGEVIDGVPADAIGPREKAVHMRCMPASKPDGKVVVELSRRAREAKLRAQKGGDRPGKPAAQINQESSP